MVGIVLAGHNPSVDKFFILAKIDKPSSPHIFRFCFATHLLDAGYDIRTVQELLGLKDIKPTMIYAHVLNLGPKALPSPLLEKLSWSEQKASFSNGRRLSH